MLGAAFLAASFLLHECRTAENAASFFGLRVDFSKKNRGDFWENWTFFSRKISRAFRACLDIPFMIAKT